MYQRIGAGPRRALPLRYIALGVDLNARGAFDDIASATEILMHNTSIVMYPDCMLI
jgi:hypothetical protein